MGRLLAAITTGLDDTARQPPPPRAWLILDPATRRYVPLPGQGLTVRPAADPWGGLTAAQLRAAGIDPGDVIDVVAVAAEDPPPRLPGSGPRGLGALAGPAAVAEATQDAERELWRTHPGSVVDELIGRVRPVSGELMQVAIPAAATDPAALAADAAHSGWAPAQPV